MPSKARPARPVKLDGFWYLRRRVPYEFRTIEAKSVIKLSTGIRVIDDPLGFTAQLDADLQRFWRDKRDGKEAANPRLLQRAVEIAKGLNLGLLPISILRAMLPPIIVERIKPVTDIVPSQEAFDHHHPDHFSSEYSIALGTNKASTEQASTDPLRGLKISQMIEEFERLNATLLAKKSSSQLKKWRSHRQTMLDKFIEINGGKDFLVSELSRKHTTKFRTYWQQRALAGEIKITSANRQMRRVAGLYKAIHDFYNLDIRNPFSRIHIPGGRDGKRLAYAPSFVQSHFLAEGMFDDINPEARRIIYLIVETGLRISEACALTRDTIHLDGEIPFIEVTDDRRETKTIKSIRQIPLVGVALTAMQTQPNGFPRYFDKATHCSNTINDALDIRNLKPQGKMQSLYSLRHTFVDRLRMVEAPKDIQEDLLGHEHTYGDGTTLEHRHCWLMKIAFKPPRAV